MLLGLTIGLLIGIWLAGWIIAIYVHTDTYRTIKPLELLIYVAWPFSAITGIIILGAKFPVALVAEIRKRWGEHFPNKKESDE
ncbi:MAG: hypothetical protein WCY93_10790 [Anaerolineaceae bacterium]